MAKKAYIGVDGVARKIKKGYIGVDGKARKIKKAYIGIGGVARPCWSGGELTVYGTITGLSVARRYLHGVSNQEYALFCGGYESSGAYNTVDAYNKSLVRTITSMSKTPNSNFSDTSKSAAAVGVYALVPVLTSGEVDAFDSSLTRTNAPTMDVNGVRGSVGISVGNYALLGGGDSKYYGNTVVAYDSSLTQKSAPKLNRNYYSHTGTNNDNYAIFGGSQGVTAYDSSLTRSYPSQGNGSWSTLMRAAFNGKYAVFMGGQGNENIHGYDSSLTLVESTGGAGYKEMASTGIGEYATFSGGRVSGTDTSTSQICAVDQSMTRTVVGDLASRIIQHTAATIGNFALHGGGLDCTKDKYTTSVTALTIA